MPYIPLPERVERWRGKQKGLREERQEGLLTAIEDLLGARFGEEAHRLLPEIRGLGEEEKLRTVLRAIGMAANLEEAKRSWQP